mmetsp:Transcript_7355/g.13693  ORF Transcript_7355/g.13693 Transcript_7355/m.13693 type:complete len:292 (-) Transcript_7355:316-1191(-)
MKLHQLLVAVSLPCSFAVWTHRSNNLESSEEFSKSVQSCVNAVPVDYPFLASFPVSRPSTQQIHEHCMHLMTVPETSADPLDDNGLKFIHITKTGGTSIEDTAIEYGIRWGRFDNSSVILKKDVCRQPEWHKITAGVKKGYNSFCVVREPMGRVISEIKYSLTSPFLVAKPMCISKEQMNALVQRHLRKFMNLNGQQSTTCHWIKQTSYTEHCDHILRFEHLPEDFDVLMQMYDIPMKLSEHRSMNDANALPEDCEVSEDVLTDETKALIKQYYADDYALWSSLKGIKSRE